METPNFRFAISATFTAEPVESVLDFWGRRLDLEVDIRFAPYNQVSQTLLDPAGDFASNRHGVNAIFVRIEDLAQFDYHDPGTLPRIEANLRALLDLVRAAAAHMTVPLIFAVCPASAEFAADPARTRFLREMTALTETVLDDAPGIQSLTCDEIERLYPVIEKHSPEAERLGRIPYTDLYFCALGTSLVRRVHGLLMPPFKVIALDCDNTLWRGICGEDGPRGVTIDRAVRSPSKDHAGAAGLGNAAHDGEQEQRTRRHRNFRTESRDAAPASSLRELALELGPESQRHRIHGGGAFPGFGQLHLRRRQFERDSRTGGESSAGALADAAARRERDSALPAPMCGPSIIVVVTEEDRHRNVYYAQAQEFGRELERAKSAEHFLETLQLQVSVMPLNAELLPRAAQLTQRTNQFNFTTIRRTEQEIQALVASGELACRTVEVSDRFGDYG